MSPLDLQTWVLLGAVVALVVALCIVVVRLRASARGRASNRIAKRGEAAAERLLRRQGYRIEDRQVTGRWTLLVDGDPVEVTCRADLLVRRRRRRFVAEVKSGTVGARATAPHTRRQLLEYRTVFAVDGVLLVDMVHRRIHEVSFPEHER